MDSTRKSDVYVVFLRVFFVIVVIALIGQTYVNYKDTFRVASGELLTSYQEFLQERVRNCVSGDFVLRVSKLECPYGSNSVDDVVSKGHLASVELALDKFDTDDLRYILSTFKRHGFIGTVRVYEYNDIPSLLELDSLFDSVNMDMLEYYKCEVTEYDYSMDNQLQ